MQTRRVEDKDGIKAIIVEDTITFEDFDSLVEYRIWYYNKHIWHLTISDDENYLVAEWPTILFIEDVIVDLYEKNKAKPLKEGDVYTGRAETDEGNFTINFDGDGYVVVNGDDGQSMCMFFTQLCNLLAIIQETKEELDRAEQHLKDRDAEYSEQQKEKQP